MDAISFTAAKANLADTMEKVCNDHTPVIMMSLEDYNAMQETAYLLSSPAMQIRVE